jgi:hypothetical protein
MMYYYICIVISFATYAEQRDLQCGILKVQVYHFTYNHALRYKSESRSRSFLCSRLFHPPHDTRVKVTLVARSLLTLAAQSCVSAKMAYSRAESVFILVHYFASISLAAFREPFSSAYSDKELPSKKAIRRVATTFWDTRSVCPWQVLIEQHISWCYDCTSSKQCISC